ILNAVGHLLHRRIEAIDRDQSNRSILWTVALRRHISFAGIDGELHPYLSAFIEMAQHQFRIEDDNVADGLDIARGDEGRTGLLHHHALRAIALHLDGDVFDIEDDVGHILAHAGNRRELVENPVDVYRLNAGALQG